MRFLLSRLMIYIAFFLPLSLSLSLSFSFHRTQSPCILSFDPSFSLSPSPSERVFLFYSRSFRRDPIARLSLSAVARQASSSRSVTPLPACFLSSTLLERIRLLSNHDPRTFLLFPSILLDRFPSYSDRRASRVESSRVESSQTLEEQASCDVRMYMYIR